MNKKFLNKLVLASYTNDQLDTKNVTKIAEYLTRKELKAYLKALKAREKQLTVVVSVAKDGTEEAYQKMFQSLFPEKRIETRVDPSLILGIQVIENDKVYNMNLQSSLKHMQRYLEETV